MVLIMVTVLILMACALCICLAFMGITTYMYLNLEKDFEKQKAMLREFSVEFGEFCDKLELQNDEARALNTSTNELLVKSNTATAKADKAAEFAMRTVQEVRKMLRLDKETGQQVVYINGKPAEIRSTSQDLKDFKFEEKESDEEPRS